MFRLFSFAATLIGFALVSHQFGVFLMFWWMAWYEIALSPVAKKKSWTEKSTYLLFFPAFITGPHYALRGWKTPRIRWRHLFECLPDILKKISIFLAAGIAYDLVRQALGEGWSVCRLVLVLAVLYLQFSAASSIVSQLSVAIGQAKVENFRNPWMATSIASFWERWHVSLGSFFRENFFNPLNFMLQKNFRLPPPFCYTLAMTGSFLLIGLWHSFSLSYLYFGLYFGITQSLERVFLSRHLTQLATSVRGRVASAAYAQTAHLIGLSLVSGIIEKNILIRPGIVG